MTAGRGDPLERRVRDDAADPVLHRELGPAAFLDVLDDALVVGRYELREGVRVFIHVVVGVEDRIVQLSLLDEDELVTGHSCPPEEGPLARLAAPRSFTITCCMLD